MLPLPEPPYTHSAREALVASTAALAAAAGVTLALGGAAPTCLCSSDATAGTAAEPPAVPLASSGSQTSARPPHAHAHFTLHRLPFRERLFRWHAALRAAAARAPPGSPVPAWPPYAGEIDEDESGADSADGGVNGGPDSGVDGGPVPLAPAALARKHAAASASLEPRPHRTTAGLGSDAIGGVAEAAGRGGGSSRIGRGGGGGSPLAAALLVLGVALVAGVRCGVVATAVRCRRSAAVKTATAD